jgi:hypothetical protein
MTSKSAFLLSFIAGVLSVVVIGALTFVFIFAWRYYRGRHSTEPSSKEIPLTTLEDGRPRSTSDKLDSSPRSPSRLGGNCPLSAEKVDEAWEPQPQFFAQTGASNNAQNDAQRPFSVVSQSSAYIIYPVTTEDIDLGWVQNHPIRVEVIPDPTTSEDGDLSLEHDQPRPFISPSPPKMPPLPSAPPVPPKSNGRLSISTVWSQESMWPREKVPDVPVPPLAHLPVTRRVMFTPLMVAGFQNRRSTSSLPRSVGQSDFEEDF